jgi:N-acetylglucosamine malate deacetylase 1
MKLDILVMAAHPDDAELGVAGTILSHIAQGYKVGIVDFTQGELGTRGTPEIRLQEAQAAAEIMGLSYRKNLGFKDGFFQNDEAHQLALIQVIRETQPNLVLANAPSDRHPDHGMGAELAVKACFLSGLQKIETLDAQGESQKAWRPKNLLHYIQDQYLKPDVVVDITNHWDLKVKAMMAFKSQFFDPNSTEPKSYISSEHFMNFIEGRAREMGHPMGFNYGEGFLRSRINGLTDLTTLL